LIPLPGIKRNQPGGDDDNATAPNNPNPVGFKPRPQFKKISPRCVLQFHNERTVFRPKLKNTSSKSTAVKKGRSLALPRGGSHPWLPLQIGGRVRMRPNGGSAKLRP
jgi:hypothetical protein